MYIYRCFQKILKTNGGWRERETLLEVTKPKRRNEYKKGITTDKTLIYIHLCEYVCVCARSTMHATFILHSVFMCAVFSSSVAQNIIIQLDVICV